MRDRIILYCLLFFSVSLFSQDNSVLSKGDWYVVSTNQNGIYKLDYNDLFELGVDMNELNINNIHIYGNGGGMLPKLNSDFRYNDLVQNAIEIYDLNNNNFFDKEDYLIFYGESANKWKYDSITGIFNHELHLFADKVNYYINISNDYSSKIIQKRPIISNPERTISTFNDFVFHEQELENLIRSGKKWFGERFNSNSSKSFNFTFPNLDLEDLVKIKTSFAVRSLNPSSVSLKANNNILSSINVSNIISAPSTEYAKISSIYHEYISSSEDIDIEIDYFSSDNGAVLWLDYIQINARRKLRMKNNFLQFRDVRTIESNIVRYEIDNTSNIMVWDITDPKNIMKLSLSTNATSISFNDSSNILREYIAFNSLAYIKPSLEGKLTNQNLHAISSDVEYVIISHPDFLDQAYSLSEFHLENSNLKSVVITPEQIYHEFSSGMQDVTAIRDFLRMLYIRDDSNLKYLLLFGDGSYDPKDRVPNNTNFIPTYQSINSTHPTLTYVTDDYFGLLDDSEGLFSDDLVDIGIGRFPVATQEEAEIVLNKVIKYYSVASFGSWRNDILFVADDGDANDGNIHMSQADSLSNFIADNYKNINISKIYLDNYLQEQTPGGPRSESAQSAINNKINKGALLVNYTGHGSPLGWTQERILELDQIQNWDNNFLPLFMTATCKFSYFDNPEKKSAGEYLLLNEKGGAIGLLSTTRLVYSSPNYNLNTKFIRMFFEKKNGSFRRLGDLFKETKVLSGSGSNNRNFTLLGDPALSLAYPEFEIITTSNLDTVKALSEITIEGSIIDDLGVMKNFNGTIYPVVFDKEIIRSTLGQQSCDPMPYRDQNNILYKGAASVLEGDFSFSFIVPKDIAYNYDSAKISYYAVSDDQNPIDASGSYNEFIIGGTANNIVYDYDASILSLYMNNRSFVDGGITNQNPILIADIYDESGINTVGNGIGHDITAILDGDAVNPFILNEYYEASKDTYKEGVISFPLYNLAKGEHTITLKVWDIFNNSSEKTIRFYVRGDNEFVLNDYTCYPNPFSNKTDFYFQHNKSNQNLNVTLNIYSVEGMLVNTINQNYFDNGYQIGPISWSGTDTYGNIMSDGVYIAQLNISSEDGDYITKSIRVILLRD